MIKLNVDGKILERTEDVITIGRSEENTVQLNEKKCSRRHARILRQEKSYLLEDLDSGNGTHLNGREITSQTIAQGDEITIGDTRLKVVELALEEIQERPPIPVEAKLEVKRKIQDRLRRVGERSVHSRRRRRLTIAVATTLVAALGASVSFLFLGQASPLPAPNPKRPFKDTVPRELAQEAEAALAGFLKEVDAAPVLGSDLIQQGVDLARRYETVYRRHPSGNPFETAIQRAYAMQAEQFGRRLETTSTDVRQSIKARRYSEALKRLAQLRTETGSAYEEAIADLVSEVDAAIKEDFSRVFLRGRQMEEVKSYREAKAYYESQAAWFEGTSYATLFATKPDALEELARAEAKRALLSVPKAVPEETPPTEPPPKPPVPPLTVKLIHAINAGNWTRSIRLQDGKDRLPASADEEGFKTKSGENFRWGDLSATDTLALYAGADFRDEDLLALADWCHENHLLQERDRFLTRYWDGNRKARKDTVDQTLARYRGLAAPPEGGYTLDPKRGWEDRSERENRVALETAEKTAKAFASCSGRKDLEKQFAVVLSLIENEALQAGTRETARAKAIDGLKAWKQRRLGEIKGRAKRTGGFQMLKALKIELNVRRKKALDAIYDLSVYPREGDPRHDQGQKVVDELVEKVREIWEKSGNLILKLDPGLRKDIDAIKAINEEFLQKLGEAPSENDLQEIDDVANNLNETISIKNFALDSREAQFIAYNRRVDHYNDTVQENGVTEDERQHAKVLNDYREMMGRKRVFLDARLNRAAKKHSTCCDAEGRIWHEGPDGTPQSRAQAEGFTAPVGENVALGYATPRDVWWQGWYRASDHHRNALSDGWNCMGYGYSGSVGTQMFSNIGLPKGFPK